jgi:hypothetical protein
MLCVGCLSIRSSELSSTPFQVGKDRVGTDPLLKCADGEVSLVGKYMGRHEMDMRIFRTLFDRSRQSESRPPTTHDQISRQDLVL